MSDREKLAREEIVVCGRSLFDRGLATGSSGNLSVRLDDGTVLITPTDVSLGALEAGMIAHIDVHGTVLGGPKPSKEAFLHLAIYDARPQARGIVHLHATHSAAVSCMAGLDPCDCMPPLTAYYVMKIGQLPLIPYHRPGDASLGPKMASIAANSPAMLLANHGPVVSGTSLRQAMNRIEELEETAKLFLLLRGSSTRPLNETEINDLEAVFGPAAAS